MSIIHGGSELRIDGKQLQENKLVLKPSVIRCPRLDPLEERNRLRAIQPTDKSQEEMITRMNLRWGNYGRPYYL